MTKQEIKNNLKENGYCQFHISDFDMRYEDGFKKHMIGADDSEYKKLMSGVRLDIKNRDIINDIVLSDLFDNDGNSKIYDAESYENAESIRNYIVDNYKKDDIFQIWHWNASDMNMGVEGYYKPYFDKMVRYFYDLDSDTKLKFNSQFTMYGKNCFLQNHKDGFVDGRLCVILIYLNEEYNEDNGGILILQQKERVLPKFGNIAILDLQSFDVEHEVTQIIGNQNRYCVLSFISLNNEE